jgi:hypothetical protein
LSPPEVAKTAHATAFDFKGWHEQTQHLSGTNVIPRKLEKDGQLLKEIRLTKSRSGILIRFLDLSQRALYRWIKRLGLSKDSLLPVIRAGETSPFS